MQAVNAFLLSDGTIQQTPTRASLTMIGELNGSESSRCRAIKAALGAGGIPVDVADDIIARMWHKFFGYACIATVCSLTRSGSGVIAQSESGESFVSSVIDECTRIVTAEGYAPPQQFVDLVRSVFSRVDSTSRASLLVDMDNGRTTKGKHTIGDLVRRAEKSGIDAPILGAALCNLHAYEINRTRKQLAGA